MKFKNPLIVGTVIALSFATTSVSADDTTTSETSAKKVNMMKIKDVENKNTAIYESLDEETKAQVMALKESNREAFAALKAEYKEMEQTDENKEALKVKMQELKDALYADLQEALVGNEEALAALDEQIEKAANYAAKKEEKMAAREANRGDRGEKVKGYKKAFAERLKNNLDTISTERLESVHGKVLSVIEKVEARTNMDADKKDALVAQLIALQEIIEDQIELNTIEA